MKSTNSRDHHFDQDYGVDGTGRVIRPGSPVRLRFSLSDPADRGTVVRIDRSAATVWIRVPTGQVLPYTLNRVGLEGDDDMVWVYGTA